MTKRYFLTRHSIKPKGEDTESERYKGISKKGESLARESAMNVLKYVQEAPSGAVVFLGGASDEPRTKSTAQVYGDRLREYLGDNQDYVVITGRDIDRNKGYNEVARQIKETIESNPDKKIIIDLPLFLKEFSLKRKGWFTEEGKINPYVEKLFEKHKGNEYEIMRELISSEGKEGNLKGPSPEDMARNYERGIVRLEKFARKYTGDRPLVVGAVGHSGEIDAYLAYLAGNGKVDLEGFDKIRANEGIIKETELATIQKTSDLTTISYRGKKTEGKSLEERVASVIAISGSILGFSFLSSNITGNVIANITNNSSNIIGVGFLLMGLIAGLFWMKTRKSK
jgi:hypothetical protein